MQANKDNKTTQELLNALSANELPMSRVDMESLVAAMRPRP